MKTKKIIAVLLTLVMVFSAGSAAFADDGNSITVSYSTAQNYEIIIPTGSASIGSPEDLEIEAVNVLLPEGKELQISMSSANGFALVLSSGDVTSVIPYSVTMNGNAIGSGARILSVPAGETSGEVTLVASVDDPSAAILAGTHTDKLRFICEVADQAAVETTSTGSGSQSGSGRSPVLDAVENPLVQQVPTLYGDEPFGGDAPSPEPEPEAPHPSPYQWQTTYQ